MIMPPLLSIPAYMALYTGCRANYYVRNTEKGIKMIKRIRIKKVITKEKDIKKDITEIMALLEQITLESVIAYDLAQDILLGLGGDD